MSKSRKTLSLTLNTFPTEVGLMVTLIKCSVADYMSGLRQQLANSVLFHSKLREWNTQINDNFSLNGRIEE